MYRVRCGLKLHIDGCAGIGMAAYYGARLAVYGGNAQGGIVAVVIFLSGNCWLWGSHTDSAPSWCGENPAQLCGMAAIQGAAAGGIQAARSRMARS